MASGRAGVSNPTGRLHVVCPESLYDFVINSINSFLPIDPGIKKKTMYQNMYNFELLVFFNWNKNRWQHLNPLGQFKKKRNSLSPIPTLFLLFTTKLVGVI